MTDEFVKPDVIAETVVEYVPRRRGRPKKARTVEPTAGFATQVQTTRSATLELEPWEEAFAKWLAEQTTRVDKKDEDAAIRLLLGQDITQNAMRRTKRKLGFIQAYQAARVKVMETRTTLARQRYQNVLPKAAKVHGKAIAALDRELQKGVDDEGHDVLPALRIAPALLNTFIDRAMPRKTEQTTQALQVIVNLTPEQARGLSAPAFVVTAAEVAPETKAIPAETPENA